jgi:CheY-like chemotaxis protein
MHETSGTPCRVLVLDTDDTRRAKTCALLERAGYATVGASNVYGLARWLDEREAQVLIVDVSVPRSWREVMDENAILRACVDERCPIVLYGDRPETELTELEWATRAASHIPAHPEGTHLLALLRRLLPEPARQALTTRPRSGVAPEEMARSATKLLLIDDSEMTLELLQSLLTPLGFDVRIAVALGEIRSIVANWAPNVIVADVKRPDIPGNELCARLKASVGTTDVVVLLCSSLPEAALASLARAARADGYVTKSHGLERFVEQLVSKMGVLRADVSYRPTEAR